MQQVAEPWLVLTLSHSALLLGLDSFVTDAPIWFLILAGGVLADHRDRRRTALLFQSAQVVCPILLVVLLALGKVHVWMIIVLSCVVGVTDALSMPSIASLIPSSVPEDDVASAIALNSAQFNLSRVLGPLLAGIAMAMVGPIVCFALNATSYVPYLLALYLLRIPSPKPIIEAPAMSARARARTSLLEAFRIVAKRRRLRRTFATVVLTSLFGMPMITFLPVLIRDAFHLGSDAFGGALSVFGFGGLVGAALVLFIKTNRRRRWFSSLAAVTLAGLIVVIALNHSFTWLLVGLFVASAAMVASNTAANSLLQSSIDGRFRGRVASMYTLALRGGAPLGSLMTGFVVSRYDVRTALTLNGLLALGLHGVLAWFGRAPSRSRATA